MTNCRRLIWHRRDLRLHDNELYSNIVENNDGVISLYVFDETFFLPRPSCTNTRENNNYEVVWCGPYAAQATIEAVTSLRESIRSIGGELLVRCGDPSIIVPQIAKEIGATEIHFSEEPGTYERNMVEKIRQHYQYQSTVKLVSSIGYTLFHPNDLPLHPNEWDQLAHPKKNRKRRNQTKKLPIIDSNDYYQHNLVDVSSKRFHGISQIMGDFRKAANAAATVRSLLETPKLVQLPKDFDVNELTEGAGNIPTLENLTTPLLLDKSIFGLDSETILFIVNSAIRNRETKSSKEFRGEREAIGQLEHFIHGPASSADRSRADVSKENSSRLSVHFALGTLSPRSVYWAAKNAGNGCSWLMSHLEMRDFFLYTAFASDKAFYSSQGLPISKKKKTSEIPVVWKRPHKSESSWTRWAVGETKLPLIDAAMKELMATGYCSNRVRQNAASVLTKDLQIDWRAGAEWFQFLLEDHCVGANFGNWLYFSGVGPDPKNRHFRTVSQMKRYDEGGAYVRKWLPTLQQVQDREALLRPWDFQIKGFESPIIDPSTQYTWQDAQILKSEGTLFLE